MSLIKRYRSYRHHNKEVAQAVEDLSTALAELGAAIEDGDPQRIADNWVFGAKPLLEKLEAA